MSFSTPLVLLLFAAELAILSRFVKMLRSIKRTTIQFTNKSMRISMIWCLIKHYCLIYTTFISSNSQDGNLQSKEMRVGANTCLQSGIITVIFGKKKPPKFDMWEPGTTMSVLIKRSHLCSSHVHGDFLLQLTTHFAATLTGCKWPWGSLSEHAWQHIWCTARDPGQACFQKHLSLYLWARYLCSRQAWPRGGPGAALCGQPHPIPQEIHHGLQLRRWYPEERILHD